MDFTKWLGAALKQVKSKQARAVLVLLNKTSYRTNYSKILFLDDRINYADEAVRAFSNAPRQVSRHSDRQASRVCGRTYRRRRGGAEGKPNSNRR